MRVRRRARPAAPVSAYPAEIEGLLDDVRQLRTTLTSDLSAAAAAVDSGAGGVARDIIEADRDDLAALERRATRPIAADRPAAHAGRRGVLGLAGAAVVLPCVAALALGGAIMTAHARHHPTQEGRAGRSDAGPAVTAPVDASRSARALLRTLRADAGRQADASVVAGDLTRLRARLAAVTATANGSRATLATVRQMVAIERRTVSRYRRESGAVPVPLPTPAPPQLGHPGRAGSPHSTVRRTRSHVHRVRPTPPQLTSTPPPLAVPTTMPRIPRGLSS